LRSVLDAANNKVRVFVGLLKCLTAAVEPDSVIGHKNRFWIRPIDQDEFANERIVPKVLRSKVQLHLIDDEIYAVMKRSSNFALSRIKYKMVLP
jgi:hypothetical protein